MILCFIANARSDQNFSDRRICEEKIKPRKIWASVPKSHECSRAIVKKFRFVQYMYLYTFGGMGGGGGKVLC